MIVLSFFFVLKIIVDYLQGSRLFRTSYGTGLNLCAVVTRIFPKASIAWDKAFSGFGYQILASISIYICTTTVYPTHGYAKKWKNRT